MSNRIAVPPNELRRLWVALGAATVFLAVTTVQGALRPEFDAWHQAVSALSLGPGGWIQMINLSVFGLVIASTAPVWRRVLAGGVGATSYPALTLVVGISFVLVGLIRQDPAPGYDPDGLALSAPTTLGLLHLAIAGVAALSSVIGLFVMAKRLSGDRAWAGWPLYSRVTAVLVVACIAVYGVWSTSASGYGGTFERFAIVIPLVWMFTFVRRLTAGVPFVVAADAQVEQQAARRTA